MRPDPNHTAIWLPTRPDFSISVIRSTSTQRGYHETFFEVTNRGRELGLEDFERLDKCDLLGSGQAYHIKGHKKFEDEVPCVMIDKRTGEKVDAPAVSWSGLPITNTTKYEYHRYEVLRICDSGD